MQPESKRLGALLNVLPKTPIPPVLTGDTIPAALQEAASLAMVARSILLLGGGDVFDFLHRTTTNDFRAMSDRGSERTFVLTEKGRTVDLVTVARTGDRAVIIGSPGAAEVLSAWFGKFIVMDDVRVERVEEGKPIPAIYGSGAPMFVKDAGHPLFAVREDLGRIPGYLILPEIPGKEDQRAGMDTDFTGLPGLSFDLLEALRIEEQVPAFGREIGPDTNVLETGLKQYVSFTKGCYIGQEVVARLDTYRKLQRIIGLFRIDAPAPSAPPTGTLLQGGREAGQLTSVAFSSRLGGWIGLGFRSVSAAGRQFELVGPGGGTTLGCTCISNLPSGYEAYEHEH